MWNAKAWSLTPLFRRTREGVFTALLRTGGFFLFLWIMFAMLQLTHSVIFTQEYLSRVLCLVCRVGLEGNMALPTMVSASWQSGRAGSGAQRGGDLQARGHPCHFSWCPLLWASVPHLILSLMLSTTAWLFLSEKPVLHFSMKRQWCKCDAVMPWFRTLGLGSTSRDTSPSFHLSEPWFPSLYNGPGVMRIPRGR